MGRSLGLLCVLTFWGCTASSATQAAADGAPSLADQDASAGGGFADAADKATDANATPSAAPPLLIAVHAGPADLPAFRLCLDPKALPLPSDPAHPMPLSNYPGVSVGGMAVLGPIQGDFPAAQLYSAFTLHDSGSAQGTPCQGLASGLNPEPITTSIHLAGGTSLLVVAGAASKRVAYVVPADSVAYSSDGLVLQFGNFAASTAMSAAPAVSFGTQASPSEKLGSPVYGTLGDSVTTKSFDLGDAAPADFDNVGVKVGATFYSLTTIVHATNPTVAPTDFFRDRRHAYALLLIDDVAPSFAQHVIAVPLHL